MTGQVYYTLKNIFNSKFYKRSVKEQGASGALVALPNVLGREVCQVYQLYNEGKLSDATNLQLKLARIDDLLKMANLGVPGMKAALDLVGLYGGPPRLPLQPLPPQQLQSIRTALVEEGFLKS